MKLLKKNVSHFITETRKESHWPFLRKRFRNFHFWTFIFFYMDFAEIIILTITTIPWTILVFVKWICVWIQNYWTKVAFSFNQDHQSIFILGNKNLMLIFLHITEGISYLYHKKSSMLISLLIEEKNPLAPRKKSSLVSVAFKKILNLSVKLCNLVITCLGLIAFSWAIVSVNDVLYRF